MFIEFVDSNSGLLVRAFQCDCSEEAMIERLIATEQYESDPITAQRLHDEQLDNLQALDEELNRQRHPRWLHFMDPHKIERHVDTNRRIHR